MPSHPSRWMIVSAAPHRIFFLLGALQLILPLLLWGLELAARAFTPELRIATTVAPGWLHPPMLIYGLFPFFIYGFLMTTFPRWLGQHSIPRSHYLSAAVMMGTGMGVAWLGVWFSLPLFNLGLLLWLLGLAAGWLALLRIALMARGADRFYEWWLLVALFNALIGGGMVLLSLYRGDGLLGWQASQFGLWLYLLPLLLTVAHRMIPFFSSNVAKGYRIEQPRHLLLLMWPALLLHLWADLSGFFGWRLLADLLLLHIGLYLAIAWQPWACRGERLLWVLHVAFAAFPLGMLLYLIQDIGMVGYGSYLLGRAPLHLLTIGFVTAMVIAMATRVSQGHSGRPLVMETANWRSFQLLELALLLRLLAEWGAVQEYAALLNLLAALCWLIGLVPWVWRYVAIYLSPRIDGRAG